MRVTYTCLVSSGGSSSRTHRPCAVMPDEGSSALSWAGMSKRFRLRSSRPSNDLAHLLRSRMGASAEGGAGDQSVSSPASAEARLGGKAHPGSERAFQQRVRGPALLCDLQWTVT